MYVCEGCPELQTDVEGVRCWKVTALFGSHAGDVSFTQPRRRRTLESQWKLWQYPLTCSINNCIIRGCPASLGEHLESGLLKEVESRGMPTPHQKARRDTIWQQDTYWYDSSMQNEIGAQLP